MAIIYSEPNRLPKQEMAFQAETNKVIALALETFAIMVYALVMRGRAFDVVNNMHSTKEQFNLVQDRSMRDMARLEDLAQVFVSLNEDGVNRAVVWAYVHGELPLSTVEYCVQKNHGYLGYLAPHEFFCESAAEWIARTRAGELPTPEFVAYYLGCDLGGFLDKHTIPEVACHLAYPFDEDDLSMVLAEAIVGYHRGSTLTPRLAYEIATEAIAQAKNNCAAGTVVSHDNADSSDLKCSGIQPVNDPDNRTVGIQRVIAGQDYIG